MEQQDKSFPKILYVEHGTTESTSPFLGWQDMKTLVDADGDEVAVYVLKVVGKLKVTTKLELHDNDGNFITDVIIP